MEVEVDWTVETGGLTKYSRSVRVKLKLPLEKFSWLGVICKPQLHQTSVTTISDWCYYHFQAMLLQLQFNITTMAVWCYYHFSLVYCVTTSSVWYYYTSDHCYLKFGLVLHVLSLQFVQCVVTTVVWFGTTSVWCYYKFRSLLPQVQFGVAIHLSWVLQPLQICVTTT